jgi:hypothetical protein
VESVDALRYLPLLRQQAQMVYHVNAPYHQHALLLLDLANYIGRQPALSCRNPARLQRAAQGTGESTSRRGDQIVDGGRNGLVDVRTHAVVLRNLRVEPKEYRFLCGRQIGPAQRAHHALNADE